MWILIHSLCLVLNISEYNLLDARNVFTCFLPGGSIQTQLKNKNWEGNCLFLLCGHTVLVLRSPHYGCSSIICSKLCMGQMGTRIINRWKRTSFKKLCLDLESYATSAGEEWVGGNRQGINKIIANINLILGYVTINLGVNFSLHGMLKKTKRFQKNIVII